MKAQARIQFDEAKRQSYVQRRQRLLKQLSGGFLLASSRPAFHKYESSYYRYHQDPNFYYLTGLLSEDQGAVILSDVEGKPTSMLFVPSRDAYTEVWYGPMIGLDGAAVMGFDEVYHLDELPKILIKLMAKATIVYMDRQNHAAQQRLYEDVISKQRIFYDGLEVRDYWGLLGDARLFKDDYELDLMRRANRISAAAHRHLMRFAKIGMNELTLQAELEKEFKFGGSAATAYHSIVASGSNATCLHYQVNN